MIYDINELREKTFSYSALSAFKKSPEHLLDYYMNRREPTKAQAVGSLLDRMILTPDDWEKFYVVAPQKPPFKKDLIEQYGKEEGAKLYTEKKEEYNKWLIENQHKTIISEADLKEAETIRDKVFDNEEAREVLSRISSTQKELRWTDKKTGIKMRGFMDGRGDGIILELKTTMDASLETFSKDAIKWGYPIQAATYSEAVKAIEFDFPDFYYLVVEKKAPYGISVFKADDDYLRWGKQEYRRLLDSLKYCLDNDKFKMSYGFYSAIETYQTLSLPGWMYKKLDESDD